MTERKLPKSLQDLLASIKKAHEEGAQVKFINSETGEEGADAFLRDLMDTIGKGGLSGKVLEVEATDCPDCGHAHDKPGNNAPSPEIAAHLLELAAIHAHPPVLVRGNFVRYRADVDYIKNGRGLHIVVDVLDPPIKPVLGEDFPGSPISYRRYDVVLATKVGGSGGYCKYLADSRELELFPDADKLLKPNS